MLGIYLFKGLLGAQLNPWVDTYLPPNLQTLSDSKPSFTKNSDAFGEISSHSLPWQRDLSLALESASLSNKKVFIDFEFFWFLSRPSNHLENLQIPNFRDFFRKC